MGHNHRADVSEFSHVELPETNLWSCAIVGAWRAWKSHQDMDEFLWLYGPDNPALPGSFAWICSVTGMRRRVILNALENAGPEFLDLSIFEELQITPWKLSRGRFAKNRKNLETRTRWVRERKNRKSWSVQYHQYVQTSFSWGSPSPWRKRRGVRDLARVSPPSTD